MKYRSTYYRPNIYVPPNSQEEIPVSKVMSDGIRRSGLCKVIRLGRRGPPEWDLCPSKRAQS